MPIRNKRRRGRFGSPRARWQWQPVRTSHDPNPPIVLETAPVVVSDDPETRAFVAAIEDVFDLFDYGDVSAIPPEDAVVVSDDPETRPWVEVTSFETDVGDEAVYIFNFDPDDHVPIAFWPDYAEDIYEHQNDFPQLIEDVVIFGDDPETRVVLFGDEFEELYYGAWSDAVHAQIIDEAPPVSDVVVEWIMRARRRARK